jgi:hypothetical protein
MIKIFLLQVISMNLQVNVINYDVLVTIEIYVIIQNQC